MPSSNILPFLLQSALQRAHPGGPPTNMTLQLVSTETDISTVSDTTLATGVPTGYPYGWGEEIDLTSGTLLNTEVQDGAITVQQYQTSLMMWGLLYAPQ